MKVSTMITRPAYFGLNIALLLLVHEALERGGMPYFLLPFWRWVFVGGMLLLLAWTVYLLQVTMHEEGWPRNAITWGQAGYGLVQSGVAIALLWHALGAIGVTNASIVAKLAMTSWVIGTAVVIVQQIFHAPPGPRLARR